MARLNSLLQQSIYREPEHYKNVQKQKEKLEKNRALITSRIGDVDLKWNQIIPGLKMQLKFCKCMNSIKDGMYKLCNGEEGLNIWRKLKEKVNDTVWHYALLWMMQREMLHIDPFWWKVELGYQHIISNEFVVSEPDLLKKGGILLFSNINMAFSLIPTFLKTLKKFQKQGVTVLMFSKRWQQQWSDAITKLGLKYSAIYEYTEGEANAIYLLSYETLFHSKLHYPQIFERKDIRLILDRVHSTQNPIFLNLITLMACETRSLTEGYGEGFWFESRVW